MDLLNEPTTTTTATSPANTRRQRSAPPGHTRLARFLMLHSLALCIFFACNLRRAAIVALFVSSALLNIARGPGHAPHEGLEFIAGLAALLSISLFVSHYAMTWERNAPASPDSPPAMRPAERAAANYLQTPNLWN